MCNLADTCIVDYGIQFLLPAWFIILLVCSTLHPAE